MLYLDEGWGTGHSRTLGGECDGGTEQSSTGALARLNASASLRNKSVGEINGIGADKMAPRKTPGGGPKPDKLMRDALALELHQEVKLTTGEKIKKLRLVARTLVDNAIDGDTTAARECFDRMDGKVTQSVDATNQVRGGVTFTWKSPAKC
jgi:hypothetical protein